MQMNRVAWMAAALLATAAGEKSTGADWPQYRGARVDGISPETLLTQWPANGPAVAWRVPTPGGFSSFSVAGGKVFTQVMREIDGVNREVCVALDAASGKELWAQPLGIGKYEGGGNTGAPGNDGGDGARSTPSVSDGRVYVMSSQLVLSCLDAESGNVLWKIDFVREHHGKVLAWENAASPVIDGDLVLAGGGGPGESLMGIDKKDGAIVWKTLSEKITHATPVLANFLGQPQVIFFTQSGLVSLAPATGQFLWRFPFQYNVSTAASPVVCGDIVYCSAGYGVGAGACKISRSPSGFLAKPLWRVRGNKPLANHWSTPVFKDGYLYGMFSFKEFGTGPMKCVQAATGRQMWSHPGFGPGNVILVGGRLLALSDTGELVLAEASPRGYHELARAKILRGKCWSTPAFSGGRAYIRSTLEGAGVDLAPQSAQR